MTPIAALDAIRNLVAAAEEAGWDNSADAEILHAGRKAYAALQVVMADAESLRDRFAGQALVGLLSGEAASHFLTIIAARRSSVAIEKLVANAAYDYADAMLAQRGKGAP